MANIVLYVAVASYMGQFGDCNQLLNVTSLIDGEYNVIVIIPKHIF